MTRTIPITPSQDRPEKQPANGVGTLERLLNVLAHTNSAVATFNTAEFCTFCSPLFEEMFGFIPSNIDALVSALS